MPTRFGFDMRRVQFSSLILTGQMTRAEAMAELEHPAYDPQLIQQDFEYIASKLNISPADLRSFHEMPKRFYWDYKNSKRLFDVGEWIMARIAGTRRGGAF